MGGNKKAHRTKGNLRPSSSGRSAELLSVGRTTLKGSLCFPELSVTLPNYVPPVGQQPDDADSSVDGNFRMVMRKMTKRDATTKLKAMQEFSELCKDKDEETVKGILAFWPRLYNKMAIDCDRRVREATHQAQEQLVLKVGRNIAPQLRSLMGVWLLSQCDPYAPAASAAKVSFNVAFPPQKHSEVYMFCKDEIFSYFSDVLFEQTPQSLSDEKITPKEEMENKYLRMISCCLLGIEAFIRIVISENDVEDTLLKILSENKFWKFSKHKDPLIRGSWYTLIISLCQCTPDVLNCHTSKLCPATLGCLAESDPTVAPAVWEAALHTVVTFEDCWKNVNVKKMVLPQLQTLLKEGGKGNAVVLFPSLLPLLSKIPQDVDKGIDFYQDFFANLQEGLSSDKVKQSPREFNAVVQAYLECFGYVISCNIKETNDLLLQNLISVQLLPLLQSSLVNAEPYLAQSCFYPVLGEMLRYMEHKLQVLQKEKKIDTSSRAVSLFWDNFITMCCSILENYSEEVKSLDRLAHFFHSLHCSNEDELKFDSRTEIFTSDLDPFVRKGSKHKFKTKVSFADEFEHNKNDSTFFSSLFSTVDQSKICKNNSLLVSSTYKLCRIVLNILQKNMNPSYLQLFTEMVGTVPSEELFESLLNSSEHSTKNKSEAPLIFFDQVIWCWLTNDNITVKEDCIVNLTFSILSCLEVDATLLVLNRLCTMKNPVLLHCILLKCLDNYSQNAAVRKWLKGPEIGESIMAIATELSTKPIMPQTSQTCEVTNAMWKCLSTCFSSTKNFEPIILPAYLEQTLCIFHKYLKSATQELGDRNSFYLTEFVCELASTLFSSFQGCFHLSSATDLLVTLFCLSCQNFECSLVGEKIMQSWQQGIKQLINKSRCLKNGGFLDKTSKMIHDMIMDLSLESSERLLKATSQLLKSVNETSLDENCEKTNSLHPIIFPLLEIMLPSEKEWLDESSMLNKMVLLPILFDDLSLFPMSEDNFQMDDKVPINYAIKAFFTSELLVSLIISQDKKHFLEEETELIVKHLPHIMFAEVCYDLSGLHFMAKNAGSTALDISDKNLLLEIAKNSSTLVKALNGRKEIPLLHKLETLSISEGYSWTLVLKNGINAIITGNPSLESFCVESFKRINNWSNITILHTLQALIPHLSSSQLACLVISSSNFLICSEEFFSLDGVLGYLVVVCTCLNHIDSLKLPSISEEIITIIDFLMGLKKTKVDFLCDCNLFTADKDTVCFVGQIALFLSSIVERSPSILSSEHWDFILCNVVGWLQTINNSKSIISKTIWSSCFVEHSCWLLRNVSLLFESPHYKKRTSFSDDLITEWNELYRNIIYPILLPLFVELSGKCKSSTPFENKYLKSMAMALEYIPADHIMKCPLPSKFDVFMESNYILQLPEYVHSLLNHLAPLLTCEARPVQLGAHCLLMKIMSKLPEVVLPLPEDKQVEREENSSAPPAALEQILKQTTHVVEMMLSDVRIGDCCLVEPYTDAYTYATGYLLTWLEVLEFFSSSSSESRSAYACYLRDSGLLQRLLSNLFCFMPSNPTLRFGETKKQSSSPYKGGNTRTMFTEEPELLLNAPPSLEELQHLACHVYMCALKKIPALVRQWWNNQDKRTADIVNRFTSKYVSGCICAQEIQAVHDADTKFNNMIVKARPVAREVVATYVIDEMSIELSIQLPSNHPLGPVAVESQRRVGVSQTLWRNWMLQLTTFLTHQNGSILDGLALWKHSVDKRFEGVEECMICFYVLHGSTYQLPRLTCRTCKKRFHSPCLYKWFSTSNNSTCPLCRNLF